MSFKISTPAVMGILNITPDSFFDGGVYAHPDSQIRQVERMIGEGATIIDIGAVSTRPGAELISETCELERLIPALTLIRNNFPGILISIDTYRPVVARAAVEHGAGMINDIYGGRFDESMIGEVAKLKVPYVLMHMKGSPANMQENPAYSDVVAEVSYFFERQLAKCLDQGINEVILDPGFGFGKTVEHNYALLARLEEFSKPGCRLLVGLSRKSMINKVLNTSAEHALNGTSVLNTIALIKGADILRVHDVREAAECIKLVRMTGLI
jgi:dihydropteroate synthase